jgi:hypothetical protein
MRKRLATISFIVLLASVLLAAPSAWAQQRSVKDSLIGSWMFVSVIAEQSDGTRSEPFGQEPRGIIVFTGDGYFSLFQSQAEVPRLATGDRGRATPEEAQGVVRASIAYFGTYTVNEADRTLSLRLLGSTFSNLLGSAEQRRVITELSETELRFTNPRTPSGLTLHTVWRRAPPM